jgi:hypothetical protein
MGSLGSVPGSPSFEKMIIAVTIPAPIAPPIAAFFSEILILDGHMVDPPHIPMALRYF